MSYISSDLANKYFGNILDIHTMNTEYYIKVTILECILELMLALPELAGVYNETQGQKKWLDKNKEKRMGNKVVRGFIPEAIVNDLKAIYGYRDKGYHEKSMTYAIYIGKFNVMAQTISLFSNMPIPKEIKDICNGNNAANNQNDNRNQPTPSGQKAVQTYKIGDRGPTGGIVFYDKRNNSDGWRYMEAAPLDLQQTTWGYFDVMFLRTEARIGSGKSNTELIVEVLNQNGISGTAVQLCKEYTLNGYNDWFLPSKDELNLLNVNLEKNDLGNFEDKVWYWSSSWNNKYSIWAQNFSDGSQSHNNYDYMFFVRPVRYF